MEYKKAVFLVFVLLAVLLAGCSGAVPGEPAVPTTAVADGEGGGEVPATDTPVPPTDIPVPTDTPVPTETSTITLTPTITNTPEPTLQPVTIVGRVWHDKCDAQGDESEKPRGCVRGPDGRWIANGKMGKNENGIADIAVLLGEGPCPSEGLGHAITNEDGWYAFTQLAPGTYCIFVNPLHEYNLTVVPPMLPGIWTYPELGIDYVTIELPYGGQATDINFGWDYLSSQSNCLNQAELVEDVPLVEEGEVYQNDSLTKRWLVRNTGNCTWSEGYMLLHTAGDLLASAAAVSLGEEVAPGETVELILEFVAPDEIGVYKSEWKIRSANNEIFGVGEDGSQALQISVTVSPELIHDNIGTPMWLDTFEDEENWNLFDDATGKMVIVDGRLEFTSYRSYGFDVWTTTYPQVFDFFIETIVTTGPVCVNNDRYGLILRNTASDKGYLIGLTCDGRYSFRRWNGNTFIYKAGWAWSEYINRGPNQTNHLGVRLVDEDVRIYVNGVLVEESKDRAIATGSFGPFVAASTSTEFTAYFEQIAYWGLGE
jgi:hypothetical protein